ncbi:hypothetical protein M3603_15450 [Rummeliibacillus stabekisii]|uniref:STM4504/CBY_0614 family protein n=1 Tax=Rummeliibacillus stabekisii TaxID=241244 RepID=UPI00203B02F6|nr:hypothetical protein [Rummeliibacillus stabekisii]MCM3318013.1 hypothetical protein [Rummeliibacillus stabekisii]
MSFHAFMVKMGFKEQHDIYEYEKVNEHFRRQFTLILENLFDKYTTFEDHLWSELEHHLKIEFSKDYLSNEHTALKRVLNYFQQTNDMETLYIISTILEKLNKMRVDNLKKAKEGYVSTWATFDPEEYYLNEAKKMEETINQISAKLLENGIGYEFINNHIVRFDNQFIHGEIVKEAIQLLQQPEFVNVSVEFMKAHEHYKSGDYKDAITNAGKAFESTMKIICNRLDYEFNSDRDTASKLINILVQNRFIPSYLQDHLSGIQKVLTSGIPTVRNKVSHGEGDSPIVISPSMVKYILNLCATNIVFLVNIYEEKSDQIQTLL